MKKIITLILICTLALFLLTSCGAKGKTLEEVKEAGQLVIVTSPDFPPFETIENGEIVGIEIDIIKKVCEALGVEAVIKSAEFDAVLVGIPVGKYDCGISGITVNPEREKNMLFTTPYYVAAQCIVVPEGSGITSGDDLVGKKVSVQTGTTAESACTDIGCVVGSYAANADAKIALTKGKVDAWVVDNLTAQEMVKEGEGLVILDEQLSEEPYAFAFTFGSEDLVEEINKIMADLIADGTITEIFADYGITYVAPTK